MYSFNACNLVILQRPLCPDLLFSVENHHKIYKYERVNYLYMLFDVFPKHNDLRENS